MAGRPRTKGSMKVITPRGRKPIMVEDHAHSEPWRKMIRAAILKQCPEVQFGDRAVKVTAWFLFAQIGPTAQRLRWPVVNAGVNANGDIDKLTRNLLDAMKDAKLIDDDCYVIGLEVYKSWAAEDQPPGITARVTDVWG